MKEIGRLAMRVEGDWWVAYYALKETMVDAVELGRIRMNIVRGSARKEVFMSLMMSAVSDYLEQAMGERPEWKGPERAPEHERAGKA